MNLALGQAPEVQQFVHKRNKRTIGPTATSLTVSSLATSALSLPRCATKSKKCAAMVDQNLKLYAEDVFFVLY